MRVEVLVLTFYDLGVQGLGYRVERFGFSVLDLGFMVSGLGSAPLPSPLQTTLPSSFLTTDSKTKT